jgi:hypothetical protein
MLVDLDEREVDALCEHYLQQMERSAEIILEAEEAPPHALGMLKIISANASHKVYINALNRVNTMRHIQRGEPFIDAAEVLAQDLAARRAHRASLKEAEQVRQQVAQSHRDATARRHNRQRFIRICGFWAFMAFVILVTLVVAQKG